MIAQGYPEEMAFSRKNIYYRDMDVGTKSHTWSMAVVTA
jgi:hypothetical protein